MVLCSGVLVAGPAAAGLFDDEIARKQIAEQQKRVDELRQQTDSLSGRLGKIEDAAKTQPVLALAAEIEKLREEMRSLRGQIEILGNNIDGVTKRQRDMYVDLDQRLRRFEQPVAAIAPAAGAAAPAAAAETAKTASAATVSVDENETYERAQGQRRIGNYQGAITAFQGFVAKYPKSTLAPRAQYWIGDSYFNLRDFKNAIASQQKLLASYPESASVPDALLNMASSQLEAGDTAAARKTMDGLIARYPASDAAEKARRRVANLR
ncbi:MAG: tol-pal system protein YbgF [Betaproteobacteria bacterium]|nr:tol-pal system protein YbgF [Betaproteobacteria bacterium]